MGRSEDPRNGLSPLVSTSGEERDGVEAWIEEEDDEMGAWPYTGESGGDKSQGDGILRLALPIMAQLLLDLCNSYAPLVVVGHFIKDPDVLAGAAIGNMVFNLSALSVCYGLASGLQTLLAQSHGAMDGAAALDRARRRSEEKQLDDEDVGFRPFYERDSPVIGPSSSSLAPASPDGGLTRSTQSASAWGSEDEHPGRDHLRYMVWTMSVIMVPLLAICMCAEPILRMLGQPESIVGVAGHTAQTLAIGCLVPSVARNLQGQVLNSTGVGWPVALGTLVGSVAQALSILILFVWVEKPMSRPPFSWFGLRDDQLYIAAMVGEACYAIAATLTTGIYLVMTRNPVCPLGCIVCPTRRCLRSCRPGPEPAGRPSLAGASLNAAPLLGDTVGSSSNQAGGTLFPSKLRLLLSLAIPSMLMAISEWWSFEFLALIAGRLPHDAALAVAANGVLYVICAVTYQVFKSIAIATGVRVAHHLGGGRRDSGQSARRVAWKGSLAAVGSACVIAVLFATVGRRAAAHIVTGSDSVVSLAARTALPAALSMVGFALLISGLQIVTGCGRQLRGTGYTFCGYYLVGIPLAFLLSFGFDQGLAGVWAGNATALWFGGTLTALFVFRLDWDQEVRAASERMRVGGRSEAGADK